MKKTFKFYTAMLLAKCANKALRLMKRNASYFPGNLALKICPNFLEQVEKPKIIIGVTGTNGKTTVSNMINDILEDNGYKVINNRYGSNMNTGIAASFVANNTISGKNRNDIAVFEMDERYAIQVFPYIKPTHVVVTNITRDQPPRQGSFEEVFNCILNSLTKDCKLILNGDDPYLQYFRLNVKNECFYFGIDKTKYSYTKNDYTGLNISRCPICNNKLIYEYYHLEHLGNYKCSSCEFKRPIITHSITSYDYNKSIITIDNTYNIKLVNNMLFNAYNILAAFTTLSLNDMNEEKVTNLINEISNNKKIYNTYKYKDRNVYVLNNKAENATTYNQSILFTHRDKKLKTIVLGWKEISRRYNFDDVSWLYDIDFEMLKNDKIDKIICTGPQKYDLATRIKYANIDENKIVCFDDLFDAEKEIKKSSGNIYAILNFDYLDFFNEIMKEEE